MADIKPIRILPDGMLGQAQAGDAVSVQHGGTGATTAAGALNNLLPSQADQSGKILSTDGQNPQWIVPQSLLGYTGSQGETGYVGSASTVVGPQGYTGSQGIQGEQGNIGYTGSVGGIGYTGSQGTTYTSATAPSNPADGDLWFDSSNGRLKIWYNDGDSSQWVDAAVGSTGYTGSSGASIAAVDTSAPASPAIGQLWYDTANTTLKIYLSGGWTAV